MHYSWNGILDLDRSKYHAKNQDKYYFVIKEDLDPTWHHTGSVISVPYQKGKYLLKKPGDKNKRQNTHKFTFFIDDMDGKVFNLNFYKRMDLFELLFEQGKIEIEVISTNDEGGGECVVEEVEVEEMVEEEKEEGEDSNNTEKCNTLKMIDLFAGTGAFSKAFAKNNIECCFANDFCKFSKKIFDINHEIELTYGDLNDIKNEDIPAHNILCGGFPCQPFSIAGKQDGFEDERANVFWKIINIIKHHSPDIVILENVKNLKSHDKGNTFKVIYDKLSKLGYHIKYEILNTSKITKIPQNRERVYIVCFKDKEKYDKFQFDFEDKEKREIKELLENNITDNYYYTDRFKVYDSVKEGVTKYIDENVLYQYRRYYVRENKSNVCPTLTANMGGGGHNVPLLKDKKGIRRLTPRECFNLQGFPSDYKLPDICDSALYKLAGNAVSVPVVELIAEKISNIIKN